MAQRWPVIDWIIVRVVKQKGKHDHKKTKSHYIVVVIASCFSELIPISQIKLQMDCHLSRNIMAIQWS